MIVSRLKIVNELKSKQNVLTAIDAGELAYGKSLNELEENLKHLFKKKFCVLTSNGFSSIFLSIKALELKNQKILIPAVSSCFCFVNAIKASGNIPIFCDVDKESGNIDFNSAVKIFNNEGFKAIVYPNHNGVICDVKQFKQFSVPIIEDCAQSFLSSSEIISNSTFQVFSFFPTKISNGIDGGAILTDNINFYNHLKDIVYYGHQMSNDDIIRYNFKMQNINSAFLLGSLSKIEEYKTKILKLKNEYNTSLKDFIGFEILNHNINFPFNYMIKFKDQQSCEFFLKTFKDFGVSKVFNFLTNEIEPFPNSSSLVFNTCSLPIYPGLQMSEIKLICDKIKYLYDN
jgi:dTDP-4-amino-4,6-dideoxygalactose transaminase